MTKKDAWLKLRRGSDPQEQLMLDQTDGACELMDNMTMADFVVIRTPLLSFSEFEQLAKTAMSIDTGESPTEDTLKEFRSAIGDHLCSMFDQLTLNESLFIASRSLHERLTNARRNPESPDTLKTYRTLLKYVSRCANRCAPFGLFAGISWAPVRSCPSEADDSDVCLVPATEYVQRCRIDMSVIADIRTMLLADDDVRRSLRYFINPTLSCSGKYWQYFSDCCGNSELAIYAMLRSKRVDGLIDTLIHQDRTFGFRELEEILLNVDPRFELRKREELVDKLVKMGVFLSTLEPQMTQGDPLDGIVLSLGECSEHPVRTALLRVSDHLAKLNSVTAGHGIEQLKEVESEIRSLLPERQSNDFVQFDLHKPVEKLSLSKSLVDDARAAALALSVLSPPIDEGMNDFHDAFIARYGRTAVPILDVFNPVTGLHCGDDGFDELLLDEIPIPSNDVSSNLRSADDRIDRLLFQKWEESCRSDLREVSLSDSEIFDLPGVATARIPESFFVLLTILTRRAQSEEPSVVIRNVGGPPGARMFTRFTSGESELAELVRKYCETEQQIVDYDGKLAEVVHWPGDRVANVLLRSPIRRTELPLYGRPSVPRQQQFLLRELLVYPKGGRLYLKCERTGQKVIPRLTTVHVADSDAMPVYRFLGALQKQQTMTSGFSWPPGLANASRFPRVVYRNCILAPQTWQLNAADLRELHNQETVSDKLSLVQEWRLRLNWPRFVELYQDGRSMIVDLKNWLSVECFIGEISKKKIAQVREAFVPDEQAPVHDTNGEPFCHELILPFLWKTTATKDEGDGQTSRSFDTSRDRVRHYPGGDWVYAKMYSGVWGREKLLVEYVRPFIAKLVSDELIDKWFFLRYEDPENHLRVRLHGKSDELASVVMPQLRRCFEEIDSDGLAWRVCLDTYEPETDRYGGSQALPVVEQIFCVDSRYAIDVIASGVVQDPFDRWRWLAIGTDELWRHAGFDLERRAMVYASRARKLWRVVGEDKPMKIAISKKFRAIRQELDELIFGTRTEGDYWRSLERRTEEMRPHLYELKNLADHKQLSKRLQDIVADVAHMHINRLCLVSSVAEELVTYEMLSKLLASRVARSRARPQQE